MRDRDARLTRRKLQTARKASTLQDALIHAGVLRAEGLITEATYTGMLADARQRRTTLEARKSPAHPIRKEAHTYA